MTVIDAAAAHFGCKPDELRFKVPHSEQGFRRLDLKRPQYRVLHWVVRRADEPRPAARPYTPAEAAEHLGRRFVHDWAAGERALDSVGQTYAQDTEGIRYTWKELARDCTWFDDDMPCGVVVTPKEG